MSDAAWDIMLVVLKLEVRTSLNWSPEVKVCWPLEGRKREYCFQDNEETVTSRCLKYINHHSFLPLSPLS